MTRGSSTASLVTVNHEMPSGCLINALASNKRPPATIRTAVSAATGQNLQPAGRSTISSTATIAAATATVATQAPVSLPGDAAAEDH